MNLRIYAMLSFTHISTIQKRVILYDVTHHTQMCERAPPSNFEPSVTGIVYSLITFI